MSKTGRKSIIICSTLFLFISIFIVSRIFSAEVKAANYGISNPRISGDTVTWDCIYFGNYYQTNSTTKEPIKWRVLSVNGDDAFLLADKALENKRYNDTYAYTTWETSSLRTWLNSTFINSAFNINEKMRLNQRWL